MARVTHIAVNLSLVVALTIQPAFAYVTGQDCSADCTSGFTCQGCGCCDVRSETAKCSCCTPKPTNDHSHGGCCGHGQSRQTGMLNQSEDDPFAGVAFEDPLPDQTEEPAQTSDGDDQPIVAAAAPTLSTSCNCVRSSEPLDAPVQRPPLTELRDILSLNNALCGVVDSVDKPPHAWSHDSTQPTITPHFSQIALCVWRL